MSSARLVAMKVHLMGLFKQLQLQYELAHEDKIGNDIFINQNQKLIAEIKNIQKQLDPIFFKNLLSKHTSAYPDPIPLKLFLKIFPPINLSSNKISVNSAERQPESDQVISSLQKSDYIYHYTTGNILVEFFNKNASE